MKEIKVQYHPHAGNMWTKSLTKELDWIVSQYHGTAPRGES
jgi:hypothetical protein